MPFSSIFYLWDSGQHYSGMNRGIKTWNKSKTGRFPGKTDDDLQVGARQPHARPETKPTCTFSACIGEDKLHWALTKTEPLERLHLPSLR